MPPRATPRPAVVSLLLAVTLPAQAGPSPLGATPPRQSLGLRLGWDSAALAGLHGTSKVGEHTQIELLAERPATGWGRWASALGAAHTWTPGGGPWGIGAQLSTGLAHAAPVTGPQLAWTAEAALRPGWLRPDRHAALWLGARGALATHIQHSDVVDELFDDRYPGGDDDAPVDGWYRGAAQTLRVGATSGRQWGAFGLSGGASFDWTPQLGGVVMNGMLGTLPFSSTLELSWCR